MTSSSHLSITTEHLGRRSVLLLRGELDFCVRDRLRRAIGSVLMRRPQILVVDLSGLDFIDCSGLSVLVWAHKRLAEQDRQLFITGGKPIVRRVICLAGVDTYLHLSAEALPWGGAGQPDSSPPTCFPNASSAGSDGGRRASISDEPEP